VQRCVACTCLPCAVCRRTRLWLGHNLQLRGTHKNHSASKEGTSGSALDYDPGPSLRLTLVACIRRI